MKKKTLKRFKEMIKPYWKTIILVTILSLIIDGAELIKPYIIQQIIDNFLREKTYVYNNLSITYIACVYVFLVIGGNAIDYLNRCISYNLGEKVVYDLRTKLFIFLEKANLSFHDKTPSGKLFVRVTSDTEDIYNLFTDVITTFPKDIMIIIGLIAAMIYISFKLSFINFAMIFFLLTTMIVISRQMNKVFDNMKITRTKLNTFLTESIYGAKLIKIFNRQEVKQKECENKTEEYVNSGKNLAYLFGVLPALIDFIENLAVSCVVVFCVYKFLGLNLEVGVIYLFISYLKKIIYPIDRIMENMEIVTDAFASIDKIYDVLEQTEFTEDFDKGMELEKMNGKIEFRNVWFAYEADNWILKDVSFTINPGESAALVGKTGSGKTTITSLICRFYEIQKGEILIDGINIKDISLESLRSNIGTILQDPFIFARSIKDNIKLYSNAQDKDIREAIKLSSANHFISCLPNGVEEIANERGNSYSAGQKQLLAFARIFAKNPSIFILDEATANIDTLTEGLIQKSVDTLLKDRTSIFIAHRLATIVNVDKIIVLNNGNIIETGNHQELLARNGYYANLYNSYYTSLN